MQLTKRAQADDGDRGYGPDVKRHSVLSSVLSSKKQEGPCTLLGNCIPALRDAHINQLQSSHLAELTDLSVQCYLGNYPIMSLVSAPCNTSRTQGNTFRPDATMICELIGVNVYTHLSEAETIKPRRTEQRTTVSLIK